ncbi:MAG TPA: PAS domain-containing protein, partial [Burkholderiaceae bacterium]|nr:PAS domain-containing protein [Burkholderiaceae bacterium]
MQSRWFLIFIGALAVAFIATLIAATLVASSTLTASTATQLRTALGAALLIALTFYLIGSRIKIGEMQSRAIAWQRSLESMKVGIALYDRDDRLINCNRAFRELYSEIAQ